MLDWYDIPNELIDAVIDYYKVGSEYALCAYLAHEYGKGGQAYLINKRIKEECATCQRDGCCSGCECGEPYDIRYMFRNLVNDIKDYKSGKLHLAPDEWGSSKDQDMPF
jgi:hypothetical protein